MKVLKILSLGLCLAFGNIARSDTIIQNDRNRFFDVISLGDILNPNRSYEISAEWSEPPDIIICRGANATIQQVESAVEWWSQRGYVFGSIVEKEPGEQCFESGMIGYITIEPTDQTFNFDFLAITDIMTHNTRREVLSARIRIRSDVKKERVLEHELGHSLGWRHINIRNHIMNSRWQRGGWSDDYLELECDD